VSECARECTCKIYLSILSASLYLDVMSAVYLVLACLLVHTHSHTHTTTTPNILLYDYTYLNDDQNNNHNNELQ